jgi:subtilisin family serine protease
MGSLDSGVEWNHPALIRQYRGWNGATADHNYNWWDAAPSDGSLPSPFPIDLLNHGTHTTGTMVGDDGKGNRVSVAPGAQWIACRAFNPTATVSALLTCLQFMLAPWDVSGNNPDPAKAPDIVNNSFGCNSSDCQLEPAYDNLAAAGILAVAAAGNSGPSCSSLSEPAVYSSVLDVSGLGDRTNDIAFFSSRGPLDGAFSKPEIAAPASNISSAIVGKFDDYGIMSGTSMASPAAAGAAALLWSARPDLIGDVRATMTLLESTATAQPSLLCGSSFQPNRVYGYGTLNAAAAVLSHK